jgi:pimeloyl-ACP methyl ester carboxylesterase
MPSLPSGRRLKKLAFLTLLFLVAWLGLSYLAIRQMTKRLFVQRPEPVPKVTWGTFIPEQLQTKDGQTLGMWFLPGNEEKSPVLLLHGYGCDRSQCLRQAQMASKWGHPVLMLSFRSHGDSTGEDCDFGWTDRHDVLEAIDWLEKKYPKRKVILWGQSMGSAASLFAAAEDGQRIEKMILECPFSDLKTATWNRLRLRFPWGVRHLAYEGALLAGPCVLPHLDDISPYQAAGKVDRTIPSLVLAGELDTRATPPEAEAIAKALGPQSSLYIFPNADHVELYDSDPEGYRARIEKFLRK